MHVAFPPLKVEEDGCCDRQLHQEIADWVDLGNEGDEDDDERV